MTTCSPTKKQGGGALFLVRSMNPVETLRCRYAQTELQLREKEDRFRRDCGRQEHELEMLRVENKKRKAGVEQMRMLQTAPRGSFTHRDDAVAESSKMLGAASNRYRASREAVDTARKELLEVEAQVTSTRQQLQELRRQSGRAFARGRPRRSSVGVGLRTQAPRARLQCLELHLETETNRLSKSIEAAKLARREIDVQLTLQCRTEELCHAREREMHEVTREISFLVEVCNVIFEERDDCQQQLADIRRLAEADNDAYEVAFRELVAVEENDRAVKVRLRESIAKLKEDVVAVAKEREAAQRVVHDESAALRARITTAAEERGVLDGDEDDVTPQLQEFERYLGRLAELAASEDLADVERYVCGGGEARFKLYDALHSTQDAVAALQRECEEVQREWEIARDGTEEERRARASVEAMQALLSQMQRETLDHEQAVECVRAQMEAALPIVHNIFTALDCENHRITSERGACTPSCETALLWFAAIEQRLEEYVALWRQQQKSCNATPDMSSTLDPHPRLLDATQR